MNAVVVSQESNVAQLSAPETMLSVIARVAADPQTDIAKMERLIALHEHMLERKAQSDFAAALADMQDELPAIEKRGDANGRYRYARWEDINAQVKPVLKKHGFSLSFRTDFPDGAVVVTGILLHKSGHSESTSIRLPADSSGNKNPVQAVASSVSYGKRYTAGALLNLTAYGEDDDGVVADMNRVMMTDDHALAITARCNEISDTMLAKVLRSYKVEALGDVPDGDYDSIMKRLVAHLQRKEAA